MASEVFYENKIYTQVQLRDLDPTRIPHHVAFIPDGNRRWAKQRGLGIEAGHQAGADNLINIVKACKEVGVKAVTFYIFSTENWNRSAWEIKAVLWLLENYLVKHTPLMLENEIRFDTIGDLVRLSKGVNSTIQTTKQATAHCTGIDMVFAVNYGARDEIRRAVQTMLDDYSDNKLKREEITEKMIGQYLDTAAWNDPDLVIRTSGEKRLSNFLLWQTSYSEVYLTNTLWPDFVSQHLLEAVLDFQKRERRLGGA